ARARKDGKLYGVPFATQSLVIYYNKKIFAQNNLSAPKTWDEFLTVLRTLRDHGVLPLANGGKEGWTLEVMSGVVAPNFYGGTARERHSGSNTTTPEVNGARNSRQFGRGRGRCRMWTAMIADQTAAPGAAVRTPVMKRGRESSGRATPYMMLKRFR